MQAILRPRAHHQSTSTSLLEPPPHGRNDTSPSNAPRIIKPQRTWRSPSAGMIEDRFNVFKRAVNWGDRVRCSICRLIPVAACLRSDQDTSRFLYLTNLDHIPTNNKSCPCCELLLECLSKPENDLFASSHVKDHLKSSSKLARFETSNSWLDWYRECSFLEQRTEDAWPFGSTKDLEEATRAVAQATNLFLSAEDHDIHGCSSFHGFIPAHNLLDGSLHAASLGMNIAQVAKPGGLNREVAGVNLATAELSQVAARMKARLPCFFVIRVYGHNESKAGAISIRGFAFGREPRTQPAEVCHFSLRAENAHGLRISDSGQMWYGKIWQPEVDYDLLKKCLETCRGHPEHQESCWSIQWDLPECDPTKHVFRLIDLKLGSVVERDLNTGQYVALSYAWGDSNHDKTQTVLSSATLQTLQETGGVTRQHLRPTIRQAMEIALRMGAEYLWVDKLCVMQHDLDPEQQAKSASLGNMALIYSRALFTIVDGSSDYNKGLLMARGETDQITAEIHRYIRLFHPAELPQNLTKWEPRAWTFQEKVLSRRMLVFSDGYAVWQCQVGTWREDVNARDCNERELAVSRSYLQPVQSRHKLAAEKYGLEESPLDGSMRLYRRSAFRQYAKCVHDYTSRAMARPEDILDACQGILDVLGSKALMGSRYSNGLPLKYLDAALLWQPQYKICRRNAAIHCPPSWSWAGWQLDPSSSKKRQKAPGQTEGPAVFYRSTFDVYSDEQGIKLHLSRDADRDGEERLRLFATFFIFDTRASVDKPELRRVGLLNAPWLNHQSLPMYEGWEARMVLNPCVTEIMSMLPRASPKTPHSRYLVVCTEEALFYVGSELFTGRRYTADSNAASIDIDFDINNVGDVDARERLLFKSTTSTERVGIATCLAAASSRSNTKRIAVKAIVLSEAQYCGDESRPDVLGYPLYNVMLVRYEGCVAERIGLGKILKSAWKRANPKWKTVVLG